MKTVHKNNRKPVLRLVAAFSAAVFFCVSLHLSSLADVVTDTPSLSGGSSSGSTSVVTGGSSSGGVIIAAPGSDSSSDSVSGYSVPDSCSGIIIGDNPLIGGGTDDTASGSTSGTSAGQSTAEQSNSAVGGAPAADASGGNTASAPALQTSDTTTGKAPETSDTASVAAPAAANAETAAALTEAAAIVTGPSSSAAASSTAGSVYANSAVTRISLDFSLITPTHSKGALKVARARVQLEDSSWQDFDYDDNVHFAFYRLKDTRTDSDGASWYIATVKARRFGDTYADDGELKTELWLNASDCIVRNTMDVSTTNPTRIAIVKAALAALGKQYIYGGNGPDAYDCSGLVKYVCKEAGITVPRTSTQLLQLDGQITAAELRPGDLLVRAGHCGIYIGNGIFVHASDSSVGVVAEYLSVYNLSNKFTNYVNVVGD